MPLTEKGQSIKHNMEKQYGPKKGEQVFYASQNKGTIKGTHYAEGGDIMPKGQAYDRDAVAGIVAAVIQQLAPSHRGLDIQPVQGGDGRKQYLNANGERMVDNVVRQNDANLREANQGPQYRESLGQMLWSMFTTPPGAGYMYKSDLEPRSASKPKGGGGGGAFADGGQVKGYQQGGTLDDLINQQVEQRKKRGQDTGGLGAAGMTKPEAPAYPWPGQPISYEDAYGGWLDWLIKGAEIERQSKDIARKNLAGKQDELGLSLQGLKNPGYAAGGTVPPGPLGGLNQATASGQPDQAFNQFVDRIMDALNAQNPEKFELKQPTRTTGVRG